MFFFTDFCRAGSFPVKSVGIGAVLLFSGCLFSPQAPDETPLDLVHFVNLWQFYESSYPLFSRKGIDWVEVAREYYPLAGDAATEEELRSLIFEMLSLLEDPAVVLISPSGDTLYTNQPEYAQNVDMDVLLENYLPHAGYAGEVEGFGWCDPAVLPYAYFRSFPTEWDSLAASAYDEFIGECVELELPAIILDIRMNPPGSAGPWYNFDQFTMSRLMERALVSAVYRVRVGPEYDQYQDWRPWIQPGGEHQFLNTVYLLIGGGCTQAAEDMAVNMSKFSNIVLVGDTTAGSITGTSRAPLGGGWFATVGRSTVLSYQYKWIEGEGVPPDVYVEATEAHFGAGIDPVFEYAAGLAGYQPMLK